MLIWVRGLVESSPQTPCILVGLVDRHLQRVRQLLLPLLRVHHLAETLSRLEVCPLEVHERERLLRHDGRLRPQPLLHHVVELQRRACEAQAPRPHSEDPDVREKADHVALAGLVALGHNHSNRDSWLALEPRDGGPDGRQHDDVARHREHVRRAADGSHEARWDRRQNCRNIAGSPLLDNRVERDQVAVRIITANGPVHPPLQRLENARQRRQRCFPQGSCLGVRHQLRQVCKQRNNGVAIRKHVCDVEVHQRALVAPIAIRSKAHRHRRFEISHLPQRFPRILEVLASVEHVKSHRYGIDGCDSNPRPAFPQAPRHEPIRNAGNPRRQVPQPMAAQPRGVQRTSAPRTVGHAAASSPNFKGGEGRLHFAEHVPRIGRRRPQKWMAAEQFPNARA
mmetsp:Transcript_87606/g.268046  ORF Transcript_87606/g.268046 Transcript_87606/m.268046 type:complete len:396 (-) Transcript_87606:74-1261(-)